MCVMSSILFFNMYVSKVDVFILRFQVYTWFFPDFPLIYEEIESGIILSWTLILIVNNDNFMICHSCLRGRLSYPHTKSIPESYNKMSFCGVR